LAISDLPTISAIGDCALMTAMGLVMREAEHFGTDVEGAGTISA
jgi:hypothetical protein